jgi:hypothetical protein
MGAAAGPSLAPVTHAPNWNICRYKCAIMRHGPYSYSR